MTPSNLRVVCFDIGIARRAGHDQPRIVVIVTVVWSILCIGQNRRHRRAATTSPAGALLIILTLGRYVAKANGYERTDINTNFHRRRATEYIDGAVTVA